MLNLYLKPASMDFSLEFMTDYASLYQISKTNDSVRCFPSCLESGHNEGGFCGSTVLAVIRMRYAFL